MQKSSAQADGLVASSSSDGTKRRFFAFGMSCVSGDTEMRGDERERVSNASNASVHSLLSPDTVSGFRLVAVPVRASMTMFRRS